MKTEIVSWLEGSTVWPRKSKRHLNVTNVDERLPRKSHGRRALRSSGPDSDVNPAWFKFDSDRFVL